MIARYADPQHNLIWLDENKLKKWQDTELAVNQARVELKRLASDIHDQIKEKLIVTPFDMELWQKKESELNHDLNAFVHERREHLPPDLRRYFHHKMTSFDTEEPAFTRTLMESVSHVSSQLGELELTIYRSATEYRFTVMLARTHGQGAELQSCGKRCLTWLADLRLGIDRLKRSLINLKFSKLSGAIGNYGGIDPILERAALKILGLQPFVGATQIMPRSIYLPTAQALHQIVQTIDKIATDIRLMARDPFPLVQEPFGKNQTGSSVMPHKKNPIADEKLEGMARLASGYLHAIELNIKTWEERAIEQSSVERVAWPDLFHVTSHAITTLTKTLKGLRVYPDSMLREIVNSRGCYAAAQAKDFLTEHGPKVGIDENAAYRIIQIAAFNLFAPNDWEKAIRDNPAVSLKQADDRLDYMEKPVRSNEQGTLRGIISKGELRAVEGHVSTEDQVNQWNTSLNKLFDDSEIYDGWMKLFRPSYLLRNEEYIFRKFLHG